ncbi:hypothetical protein, partial [Streptomyces sp. SID4948]|uniref:hypothetical protein n=1 Tax=Streptomyces sp. SID4948 TaxID=2690287 RepID=UPI001F300E88
MPNLCRLCAARRPAGREVGRAAAGPRAAAAPEDRVTTSAPAQPSSSASGTCTATGEPSPRCSRP